MEKYNFYYNKQPISKNNFIKSVPNDWEEDLDEDGNYSYGYYSAINRN